MTLSSLPWRPGFGALPDVFFQSIQPTPIPAPYLVSYNAELAAAIGFPEAIGGDPAAISELAGNGLIAGTNPISAVYAGHQFGVWVPQLGDGRAILLGEVEGPNHERFEIQLKGAGLTRYSRMGDGRAVLRSTIREYLASEAMHGLGVPTTRALAIVGSDLPVYRERTETAAVLTRVAPGFVRFGSFEFFASRGDEASLRLLADHVIERHFPARLSLPAAERYSAWYADVVRLTATLMADWIAVGFTHGVMNTDNMSILGLSLDYGPYGWMDEYDPNYIPNHTDRDGRYSYGHQPGVGLWNCARLGEALHSLVPEGEALAVLEGYRSMFAEAIDAKMRAKFGLTTVEDDDLDLIHDFLALMHKYEMDYTQSFRKLSLLELSPSATEQAEGIFTRSRGGAEEEKEWWVRYRSRLARDGSIDPERHQRMRRVNPKYVLRNWMAQEAITMAETRNYSRIEELRGILAAPFDEHPEFEHYAAKPPEWAKHIELSCSS